MKELTIRTILRRATDFLIDNGIEEARLDAEVLLAHVLNTSRLRLYVDLERNIDDSTDAYKNLIRLRAEHIPVAQLIGVREFMGLDFNITPDVLIPRPETELLVQISIENLERLNRPSTAADIGTGSGAIAVSIAHHIENVTVDATDISPAALAVARSNAEKFSVDRRINFVEGNLLEPLSHKKFDAIISNPPYIPTAVIDNLQPEVSKHEPRLALDGGLDGLDCYRKIIGGSARMLNDDGFIALEIGINQAAPVTKIIDHTDQFNAVDIVKDLNGIDRIIVAHKK